MSDAIAEKRLVKSEGKEWVKVGHFSVRSSDHENDTRLTAIRSGRRLIHLS